MALVRKSDKWLDESEGHINPAMHLARLMTGSRCTACPHEREATRNPFGCASLGDQHIVTQTVCEFLYHSVQRTFTLV